MATVWHTLKIFVSSTFLDLELARDKLSGVFRELENELLARQLVLRLYDLRWQERELKASIVDWCLDKIDVCQYFIGIVGTRYGWRPPCGPRGSLNQARLSITEMEFRHALQNIPPQHRFFCVDKHNRTKKEDAAALAKLKDFLRHNQAQVFEYGSIEELLAIVGQEVKRIIDQDYPPGQKVESLVPTYGDYVMEIIIEKSRDFIGRQNYLERLNEFATSSSRDNYLAIEGVAGIGKTALVAKFFENLPSQGIPVVAHFMGMGGNAAQVEGFYASLAEQLYSMGWLNKLAQAPQALRHQVENALQQKKRLVIILDGLEEIEEAGQDLNWLARELPPEIRVILTMRPSRVGEALQTFPHLQLIELKPLGNAEISALIDNYTRAYNRELDHAQRQLLLQQGGNPLYLKAALDELFSAGTSVGQLATTVDHLFEQIVARLQQQHGRQILDDYLGIIAAARHGAWEHELKDILGFKDELLLALNQELRNFVISRAGGLEFFHPQFERSVKMLLGRGAMRAYHQQWANYLQAKGYHYIHTLEELPFQLQWAESYQELLRLLTDFAFLEAKVQQGQVRELCQDIRNALLGETFALPQDLQITVGQVQVDPFILTLILQILEKEGQFLTAHPTATWQCFWNLGYWHDHPGNETHYQSGPGKRPWMQSGHKLYQLVAAWQPESKGAWLRSRRPLLFPLAAPLLQIFRGHSAEVTAVAFSPDGHTLASCSEDHTLKLWDALTGKLLGTLAPEGGMVYSLSFSPDSTQLAAGLQDNTIRVWELEQQKPILQLQGHDGAVLSVSYSPDGKLIVSGAADQRIGLWNSQNGALLTFLEQDDLVTSVAIDPHGTLLASASHANNIRLWELTPPYKLLLTIPAHAGPVEDITFSPDGQLLASASYDQTIKLWNPKNGALIKLLRGHGSVVCGVSCSPDGTKLASAGYDQTIILWDLATGQPEAKFKGHSGPVRSVHFNLDNRKIVSAGADMTVRIWDATAHEILPPLKGPEKSVVGIACSNDKVFVASKEQRIWIWHLASGTLEDVWSADCQRPLRNICISPSYERLAASFKDGSILIWDIAPKTLLQTIKAQGTAQVLCISHDNTTIAAGYWDKIHLWNCTTGEELITIKSHDLGAKAISFSPDDRKIAAAQKEIRVWDAHTKALLHILAGHEEAVISLVFSPDGSKLASASQDNQVKLWDLYNGACLETIPGCIDAQAIARQWPYYIGLDGIELTVKSAQDHQPIAFWASPIEMPGISATGYLSGYFDNYLYLLKLEGCELANPAAGC